MIIKSQIKNYELKLVDNVLAQKKKLFSGMGYGKLFYFIDDKVYLHYERPLKKLIGTSLFMVISAKERNKSYLRLAQYYRGLVNNNFRRNDILVVIGGGILQDIGGFIASTLYRGIRWVFLPTTLLSQSDSCIGSKTSINFDNAKNLIGTFYPPNRIYIDTNFCHTLSNKDFMSGIGEIIKFHFLSDYQRYALLKKFLAASNLRSSDYLKAVVLSTLEIKKSYFEKDEFDKGVRNLLNYGHCFGHALESAAKFLVSHGEAVIVGMGFANLLSLRRGILNTKKYNELEGILRNYYPKINFKKINVDSIINFMRHDKKRSGKALTMVLTKDIGRHYKYDDIKESEIRHVYPEFITDYP